MKKKNKAKVPLINASDEGCFWTCDGKVLRNLEGLVQALKEMNDDAFRYHVNKEKNDFTKWVKEVLQDSWLARELKRSKTRLTFIKKIEARLKELK